MHKTYLAIAALLGAIAVALGAFGAHGLKNIAAADTVATFDTAVRYQFFHVFALLFVGILYERFHSKWVKWAGAAFITGILLFSGSLYAITSMKINGRAGLDGIGIITPVGGIFFIIGWVFLFAGVMKKN